ncbi:hypothetical protein BDV28DRAFT_162273 [Aspergillus coremiiformis]|uniref:Uncharacterized protein n=1 Tax=Aspergillus coremiiformis TaxID=138285 RepID=A0A5N6ZDX4_9EURO|nr:hypothetical protein BDV28DRAFT_162273 [Aspergillus coremiiformis]
MESSSKQPFITRGSFTAGSHKPAPTHLQPQPSNTDLSNGNVQPHHDHNDRDKQPGLSSASGAPRDKHRRHLAFDSVTIDPTKFRPRPKHKHSKSRDGRFPRIMNPSARGLLPTWSGTREKESDPDDGHGLLRPITRETTPSRWGSESTTGLGTGSRKGSIFDEIDQNNHLGLIRRQEIRSLDDLDQVRDKRRQGERYLRYALSMIGTLATDITRRLDYTYYNLLEKLAALHATIASFQELSDSTPELFSDFERETTGLDQEIRKQIGELKDFQPQMQKIEALEKRMRVGRMRAEALSCRLEEMRKEIDCWERKEAECQIRISRRLRIFWVVVSAGILILAVALIAQNRITANSPHSSLVSQAATVANGSTRTLAHEEGSGVDLLATGIHGERYERPPHPSTNPTPSFEDTKPTAQDPWRIFDEL